jgi:hypothetical protein
MKSREYLNKLQTVFPEWDWKKNQNGFNPPLTIEDAITRLKRISPSTCVVLLILNCKTISRILHLFRVQAIFPFVDQHVSLEEVKAHIQKLRSIMFVVFWQ